MRVTSIALLLAIPRIFVILIHAFDRGKELKIDLLPDVLVNQGFVPSKLRNEWAKYFARAVEDAGLIEQDGGRTYVSNEFLAPGISVPSSNLPSPIPQPIESVIVPTQERYSGNGFEDEPQSLDSFIKNFKGNIVRKTLSEGREFVLIIPEDLTKGDIAKIRLIMKSNQDGLDGYLIDGPNSVEGNNG